MPTVNLGKVGMTLKGVYEDEAQYEKLDVVYYDDSTYCAKVSTKGNTPSKEDDTYWQLLVAPNPLATWKPNTKEDEGYVQKGEGHTDSLWATDSDGNPAWVKKDDVATKVETNSKTADGIVTKGQDSPDKVWATDSEGNPAWRDNSSSTDPFAVVDLTDWDYNTYIPNYFYRIILKITVKGVKSGSTVMNNIGFSLVSADNTNPPMKYTITIPVSAVNETSATYFNIYFNTYEDTDEYDKYRLGVCKPIYTPGDETISVYLVARFIKPQKYYLYNLTKAPKEIIIENIFEKKEYIDIRRNAEPGYTYYGYGLQGYTQKYYPQPLVSRVYNGLVPRTTSNGVNQIFGADSEGIPKWQSLSDLKLLTSAQVDAKIAEAITEANVPQFVELDHIPTVEEAEPNKFYLVKNEDTQHYDIYALLGEKVELIDDTTVDLTNYTTLTDEQYNALIELLGEE